MNSSVKLIFWTARRAGARMLQFVNVKNQNISRSGVHSIQQFNNGPQMRRDNGPPLDDATTRRRQCWESTRRLAAALPTPASEKLSVQRLTIRPAAAGYGGAGHPSIRAAVCDEDAIDCALRLRLAGHRPVVLNIADGEMRGGRGPQGSTGQEESLMRRCNLYEGLGGVAYPLHDDDLVYTRSATVLRASEADGWALLDPPVALDFITCSGLHPAEFDAPLLARKLAAVIRLACERGHDVPVLGTLGVRRCAQWTWRSPAGSAADAFADVLKASHVSPGLSHVVFAILRRSDDLATVRRKMVAWQDEHDVFERVFQQKGVV
jgi:uncharacterized protein (TIGR02452 family)